MTLSIMLDYATNALTQEVLASLESVIGMHLYPVYHLPATDHPNFVHKELIQAVGRLFSTIYASAAASSYLPLFTMHAAQSFCRLRCLTAAAAPRAVLTPSRTLQCLSVPKTAYSSTTTESPSRPNTGIEGASARRLTGPFGFLAASTLTVAAFMVNGDHDQ